VARRRHGPIIAGRVDRRTPVSACFRLYPGGR
jgi:hypothetical protein